MGKDYYGLLGISRDADEDAIKRAYKKAALKWHPDRNAGSEEASQKFKEVRILINSITNTMSDMIPRSLKRLKFSATKTNAPSLTNSARRA